MFIRQACFVGVDPPLVRNLHSHTGCRNGNCPWWQEFMLQVRICKVTDYSSYINYNVTGYVRLIGVHLGDHRVDVSELQVI